MTEMFVPLDEMKKMQRDELNKARRKITKDNKILTRCLQIMKQATEKSPHDRMKIINIWFEELENDLSETDDGSIDSPFAHLNYLKAAVYAALDESPYVTND